MPCTACRSTSSAIQPQSWRSFSATYKPIIRYRDQGVYFILQQTDTLFRLIGTYLTLKTEGLGNTATVRARFARWKQSVVRLRYLFPAHTGGYKNIAPLTRSASSALLSSAAFFPISGLAPAPARQHLRSAATSALIWRTWASVFMAINSTFKPASIAVNSTTSSATYSDYFYGSELLISDEIQAS